MGYIYKYVNINNEIEYIGKTTRPIKYRILEHQSQDLSDFNGNIYYAKIETNYDLDIIEMYLIHKYNPPKNKKLYTTSNFIFSINEEEIKWKLFDKNIKQIINHEPMVYCDLKKILFEKGLTQSRLSDMTGIRSATINDMCNGKTKSLPLQNIGKICVALECKVDDLIKIV